MTTRRRSANIYDYPEHLNPFHEEDNHSKLRFWNVTKNRVRSNSFSFPSVKDFRSSFRLPRPRTRSNNSSSLSQLNCLGTQTKVESSHIETSQNNTFLSTLRRRIGRSFSIKNKNKATSSSDDSTNDDQQRRYASLRPKNESIHYISTTPLPRMRFHERIKNPEPDKLESPVSSLSDDKNPFNDDFNDLQSHSPTNPVTPARKKKRAPPPPPVRQSSLKDYSNKDVPDNKQNEENSSTTSEDSKQETEEIKTNNTAENESIHDSIEEIQDSIIEEMKQINNDIENLINYNSEKTLSGSQNSLSSETKLEIKQKQQAIEDTSDLKEIVNKLKIEVDKLTDDTNNNIISSAQKSQRESDEEIQWRRHSPDKVKTELNIYLDHLDDDDDDDVICRSSMSPPVVRLRKDSDWIRH